MSIKGIMTAENNNSTDLFSIEDQARPHRAGTGN